MKDGLLMELPIRKNARDNGPPTLFSMLGAFWNFAREIPHQSLFVVWQEFVHCKNPAYDSKVRKLSRSFGFRIVGIQPSFGTRDLFLKVYRSDTFQSPLCSQNVLGWVFA